MTHQDPNPRPRRIRRGLTAAHFWNAALALGFVGASVLFAESRLGAEYAHLLLPVVVAAGLVALAISTILYRSDVASLPCPLDRCERTLDAMAFGRLPEPSFEEEALDILGKIRELTPTPVTTAERPVSSWLVDEEPAPLPTPAATNGSAFDLLRLDDPAAASVSGPAWEFPSTRALAAA